MQESSDTSSIFQQHVKSGSPASSALPCEGQSGNQVTQHSKDTEGHAGDENTISPVPVTSLVTDTQLNVNTAGPHVPLLYKAVEFLYVENTLHQTRVALHGESIKVMYELRRLSVGCVREDEFKEVRKLVLTHAGSWRILFILSKSITQAVCEACLQLLKSCLGLN
ncbi:unnamed protein product [Leuciscus chuanchicus]